MIRADNAEVETMLVASTAHMKLRDSLALDAVASSRVFRFIVHKDNISIPYRIANALNRTRTMLKDKRDWHDFI